MDFINIFCSIRKKKKMHIYISQIKLKTKHEGKTLLTFLYFRPSTEAEKVLR